MSKKEYLTAGQVLHFIKNDDKKEIALYLADHLNKAIDKPESIISFIYSIMDNSMGFEDELKPDSEFYHNDYYKGEK